MNNSFAEANGKPAMVRPAHVNLGIAIDLAKPDGSRNLVVPSIKGCEEMDFRQFWQAYEDVVRRARRNELTMEDYSGTTISLTNPGGIGTVHSMPRLMQGQSAIIGVGAMEYPAPYQGMSEETLAELAVSKIITLTSTYDHRIIQGAQSGEFLKVMHELMLGEHGFYDEIFTALRIPYEPVRWMRDVARQLRGSDRQDRPGARADPRVPGARSPDGRHRPAGVQDPQAPRPGRPPARADPVGPGPRVPGRRLRRQAADEAARRSSACCATRTAAASASSTCTSRTRRSGAGSRTGSSASTRSRPPTSRSTCSTGSTPPRRSRPSCRPSTSARSASRWRAASR